MKNFIYFLFIFFYSLSGLKAQIIVTSTKEITICDEDGDGFVTIPFSDLQSYVLDILSEFDESPEIYVTKAHRGVEKITNLYTNPQITQVCGDVDGDGGYYDIAINSQKEIYVTRRYGVLQRLHPENCYYETLGQIHANGQTNLALSFDHLDHLYEGGWTSEVYRSDYNDITNFYLWHDFDLGNPSGDFVQIGDYLYVAWTMPDGKDHLLKVTLGPDNVYMSHEDLGKIETGTFGLAAEYGRLYGNTVDFLYEIDLETMDRTVIAQRPNQNNTAQAWWGAAGFHEGLHFDISYHPTQNDAENNTNPLTDPYTNPVAFEDGYIYIRVHEESQNTTYIIPVHIVFGVAPEAENAELLSCRDSISGMAEFHLPDAQNDINPDNTLLFKYYNSLQDLEADVNSLPENITIGENKAIYVKVTNGLGVCYGIAELRLVIRDININYQELVSICDGGSGTLSVPDIFISYEWVGIHDNDFNQPLDTHEVTISHTGEYTVYVEDENGCNHFFNFKVLEGDPPIVSSVIINSDHSITVEVSPSGDYEYSLDGILWQSSPTFYNVDINDYVIHVKDLSGCKITPYPFTYFQIPNFISPNGDGINDTWKIRGIENYPNGEIKIFDRYGKMFVHRKINSEVLWDGTYMGRTAPSGTYWYILTLDENNKFTGHINVRN